MRPDQISDPMVYPTGLPGDPLWPGLGKIAYRVACMSPIAFLVMAFGYPPTSAKALPHWPVQLLWWACAACAPIGILLGVIAFSRELIDRDRGRRIKRPEYSTSAIVVGIAASLSLYCGTGSLNGIRTHNEVRGISCLSNIKQLNLGMLMYAQDFDDRFPPPGSWKEAEYPYLKNESIFHCPEADEDEKRATYAMNRQLNDKTASSILQPAEAVMVFDSVPGNNLNGGPWLLPDPPRHKRGDYFGFVDGHAKWFSASAVQDLQWHPTVVARSAKKR